MTMQFRTIRDAIISLLGTAAAGRYRVLGYQEEGTSPEAVLDSSRTVQVFYSRGKFPKSTAATRGPYNHDMTFVIQLEAAKRAEVDLSVLNNPAATSVQVQAAWAALKPAEQAADESLDELWDHVFNELNDARNIDFGLSDPVGSRWVDEFAKDDVLARGEYAVITGRAQLTCEDTEYVTGETPQAVEIVDVVIDIPDDDVEKTGVRVDYP